MKKKVIVSGERKHTICFDILTLRAEAGRGRGGLKDRADEGRREGGGGL